VIRVEFANVPEVHHGEWRAESNRRTFNERVTPETGGIDVTLDYLNGTDSNTMVSPFLMFYSHERRRTFCT